MDETWAETTHENTGIILENCGQHTNKKQTIRTSQETLPTIWHKTLMT